MKKERLEEMINQGKTQREMSEELNISQTGLRYWLTKFELKTKNGKHKRVEVHRCRKCGEEDSEKFYGNDKVVCSKCHNDRVKKAGKEKREYALKKLGYSCLVCGFDKYGCSLDIHHLNPEIKDNNFNSLRGWSLKRIDKEIEGCVLLCKNCHAGHHNGYIDLEPYI